MKSTVPHPTPVTPFSLIKQNRLTKEEYFNNIKENPDWEPEKIRLEEKIQDKIKKGNTKMATDLGD